MVLNLIFNVVVRAVTSVHTTLPMFIIVNSAAIAVVTTEQKFIVQEIFKLSMYAASLFWRIAKE